MIQHNSISVVELVYHHRSTLGPVTVLESRYNRPLVSDAKHFTKEVLVGEAWQPIDVGWVEQCSMLIVSNDEGKHLQVTPTLETKRDYLARKIIVGHVNSDGSVTPTDIIPAGESFRTYPTNILSLRLMCRSKEARGTVSLIPQ